MIPNYWSTPSVAVPSYQPIRPIIDWVNGRAGAEAYPMAPNSKVLLLDTQESVIYTKSTDNVGRATLTISDIVERTPVKAEPQAVQLNVDYDKIREIVVEEIKNFTAPSEPAKKSKKEA